MNEPRQTENSQTSQNSNFVQRYYSTIGLGVLVVILAIIGYAYSKTNHSRTATLPGVYNDQSASQSSTPLVEGDYFLPHKMSNPDPYKPPVANTTVKWQQPVKLPNLKLIVGYSDGTAVTTGPDFKTDYYKLGTHGQNDIILAQSSAVDPGGQVILFFEKKSDQDYVFMAGLAANRIANGYVYTGHDSSGNGSGGTGYLISGKLVHSADTKTYYFGVVGPTNITYSGMQLTQPYSDPYYLWTTFVEERKSVGNNLTYKKVTTLPTGDLYQFQVVQQDPALGNTQTYGKYFVLKLPSGLYTPYNVSFNFLTDNSIPKITWQDGTKNSDPYRVEGAAVGGCGYGGYVVPSTDVSADVQATGTTSTGQTVYEFKDAHNPYLEYFYKAQGGQYFDQSAQKQVPISIEDWNKHHPVVMIKNAVGEYMIMTNQHYGLAAECGKPVIYLYPNKDTKVTVKVGADVTKSEPNYGQGWTVLAKPSGQLFTADNHQYDSLFWEGTGHGDYPSISQGFMVPHDQIESTLTSQLHQLGLNDKEASDFKAFWLPKMPNTKYVRFTWFTNKELDRLAPLSVTPRPNTVIRVFLDFQGTDQSFEIPTQTLTAIPRRGFTVVEWGGLLK